MSEPSSGGHLGTLVHAPARNDAATSAGSGHHVGAGRGAGHLILSHRVRHRPVKSDLSLRNPPQRMFSRVFIEKKKKRIRQTKMVVCRRCRSAFYGPLIRILRATVFYARIRVYPRSLQRQFLVDGRVHAGMTEGGGDWRKVVFLLPRGQTSQGSTRDDSEKGP